MALGLPPLNVSGSFGAGPSGARNRIGSVFMGGMNVPAYPAFPVSADIAGASAPNRSPRQWYKIELIVFVSLATAVALVVWKRKGK